MKLTPDDPPMQPAARVTGWITRTGDGGWNRVRASKSRPREERGADPDNRADRIAGCNGKVRELAAVQLKDGTWRRVGDVVEPQP